MQTLDPVQLRRIHTPEVQARIACSEQFPQRYAYSTTGGAGYGAVAGWNAKLSRWQQVAVILPPGEWVSSEIDLEVPGDQEQWVPIQTTGQAPDSNLARWESRSGKHWVELTASPLGFGYRSPSAGGGLYAMDLDAALAELQAKVDRGHFLPDAAKTPMRRVR